MKAIIQAVEVKLSLKIEQVAHRLLGVEKENEVLRNKIESLERNQRKNNIIVFGIERSENYINADYIIALIKDLLNIELVESDISDVYPLGKSRNSPIKIEFTSYLRKLAILKNAKKLKDSRLSISQDFTERQRRENKILRKHMIKAK